MSLVDTEYQRLVAAIATADRPPADRHAEAVNA